jgi:Domain of unknown function (DUF4861)
MKKSIVLLACMLLVATAFAQETALYKLKLYNPSDLDRPDEPILMQRQILEKMTGPCKGKLVPLLKNEKGEIIPSQADDITYDKKWDELAFLISFKEHGTVNITVEFVEPDKLPRFPVRAHASLGISTERNDKFQATPYEIRPSDWKPQAQPARYLMEGPGWENDMVAFRSYFDSRNGKDIFGKKTAKMMIDSIGIPKTPLGDYHTLKPWGMDILKVGASLGAGAIGVWYKDKIYTIGEPQKAEYRLIADGPIRAIIHLDNTKFTVADQTATSQEEISIWAGKYYYQNKVIVSGIQGPFDVVTGIVNMKNDKPEPIKAETKQMRILATHAKQSENNDILGMGLILNAKDSVKYVTTPKTGDGVINTFAVRLKATERRPVTYYFAAGWEGSDPKFKEEKYFTDMLTREARKISIPIRIMPGNKPGN